MREAKIFQIKVTLRGSRPPIWRRMLVHDTMLLGDFHHLLQIAMGWMDYHLHLFIKQNEYFGPKDPENPDIYDESKVRLKELLRWPKERIVYEYDFGDDWLHDIVLEKVVEADPKRKYPWIVAGKRACPPEDCGGIYGYYRMLAAINDPNDPDRGDWLDWLGEDFDPDAFSVEEVNAFLHGNI